MTVEDAKALITIQGKIELEVRVDSRSGKYEVDLNEAEYCHGEFFSCLTNYN